MTGYNVCSGIVPWGGICRLQALLHLLPPRRSEFVAWSACTLSIKRMPNPMSCCSRATKCLKQKKNIGCGASDAARHQSVLAASHLLNLSRKKAAEFRGVLSFKGHLNHNHYEKDMYQFHLLPSLNSGCPSPSKFSSLPRPTNLYAAVLALSPNFSILRKNIPRLFALSARHRNLLRYVLLSRSFNLALDYLFLHNTEYDFRLDIFNTTSKIRSHLLVGAIPVHWPHYVIYQTMFGAFHLTILNPTQASLMAMAGALALFPFLGTACCSMIQFGCEKLGDEVRATAQDSASALLLFQIMTDHVGFSASSTNILLRTVFSSMEPVVSNLGAHIQHDSEMSDRDSFASDLKALGWESLDIPNQFAVLKVHESGSFRNIIGEYEQV